MVNSLVTSTLSQAGMRILDALVDLAQEYDESTDRAVYTIIEMWAYEAMEPLYINAAFNAAQDAFQNCPSSDGRRLELFASLLEYGGELLIEFAANLWLAYLFRMETAADLLWTQYSEIQRNVIIETGRNLPRSWGEWILPMQDFFGLAEGYLIEQNGVFDNLFTSEDVYHMLEALFAEEKTRETPKPIEEGCLPPEPLNAAAALHTYLMSCRERVGSVDPRGYPRSINTTVPLSDVYVPLRLVPLDGSGKPERFIRYQTAAYDHPDIYSLRHPLDHLGLENEPTVTVSEALNQNRLILILGELGSGKTTLLRHLVYEHTRVLLEAHEEAYQIETHPDGSFSLRLTRSLPLYLDLADYASLRYEDERLTDYLVRAAVEMTGDSSVGPLLERLIETGQCLILLDGLDQAVSDEQRRMLVSSVPAAAAEWRVNGNRVIVTSRLENYEAAPLPRDFKGYVINRLDRGQINTLVLKWKMTMARVDRPLIGDEEAIRRAQTDTLSLIREVARDARLYRLAGTPLLLRMLVEVYRPGMIITPQRVAIYQLVANALIRDWRLPHTGGGRPAVLGQEVEHLISVLAAWLHEARPTGTLNEQEIHQILGNIWAQMHTDMAPEDVEVAIDEFLTTVRRGHGVLIELAPQRYGFSYQGLQEYFAARYIISSYRMAPERIRMRLHDPRWDEVIRLALTLVALRSRDDATDLMETAVLARGPRAEELDLRPSLFDDYLKRDLFYAARLLGDDIDVHSDVLNCIVDELMTLWLDGERNSLGRFALVFDTARRHLVNLNGAAASRRAFSLALRKLREGNDHERGYAADALTFWQTHITEGRDALVEIGRDAPPLVRAAIAEALGHVGELSREAYVLLLGLTADPDERVGLASQRTLSKTEPVPYEALSMWVRYLHSSDAVRQRLGLRMLEQVGSLPPLVIGELLNLAENPDATIRQRAIDVLGGVSNLPDDALTALCRMISDNDPDVRVAAISAMSRPVLLPHEVIEQLIRWSNDSNIRVKRAAVDALGTCLNDEMNVIEAMIERLGDPVDSIREAVIEPLVAKAPDNPRVKHLLTHVVRDNIHRVRCAVARALRYYPEPDDEIRDVLTALMNDREMIVREAALSAIGQMREPGKRIIDYLVDLAQMNDSAISEPALRALSSLRSLPEHALSILVEMLPVFWESHGAQILECLRAHAPLPPAVVYAIMDYAVSRDGGAPSMARVPSGLRAIALEVLGFALDETPAALQILLDAAMDSDAVEVRVAALHALSRSRIMTPSIQGLLVDMMKENRSIEVRCAAGTALGTLIYCLPEHMFTMHELLDIANELTILLDRLPARAAWETDATLQNELYMALTRVVARARPTPPRLAARSENAGGDLY